MLDIQFIEGPAAATVALEPVRSRLLSKLAEPASAATLATRVGLTRQKVNYHLHALEGHGLVRLAEERKWRGLTERLLVATASSYVVSPGAVGPVAVDPNRQVDRLSASFLIAPGARVVREEADLVRRAHEAGKRLATLAVDTEVRFRSPTDRAAFSHEFTKAVTKRVSKYHDASAPGGRASPGGRGAPAASETRSQGVLMRVKKEASGRRSVQVEVPGTQEEVWQAIATGPGILAWFVPTEFEERDVKPIAIKLKFGQGMEPRSEVTAWDPPRMFATVADSWVPGSQPIANEWSVQARGAGVSILRIVQSLFASTDDWENQLESAQSGLSGFLAILRVYLTYFRGQRSAMKWLRAPAAGTQADAWEALTAALGLQGVRVWQRWTAPAGVPAFSGVVEYVTQSPYDALLRLNTPGPGVAARGTVNFGGQIMVAMHLYLYGAQAAGTVAREAPLWEAWFQRRIPTPAEPGKSE